MKYFLIPFMSVVIVAYFVYHGIYGRRGWLRLNEINQEYIQVSQKNKELQSQVKALRLKVNAMTSQSRDLIEEEMMRVLNMGDSEDVIILDGQE